ncbi:alpha-L-rhamnosidase [Porphyromonadaceae bacterium KH3R12]|nr:alpha-L-rhamnosidase [Porphyromonadaceae bacterium KH3R12]
MIKYKILRLISITTAVLLMAIGCKNTVINSGDTQSIDYEFLSGNFKTPDQSSGVNCWWWWLNGNVTKDAITKDLGAMKSKNFQGAMIFDAGGHNQRGNKDIPAGPLYGSDEWIELFVFALDEAKRLGLEIGFNIQSGWNLGGPRVTPEHAAKQLTYSETKVKGGQKITQSLSVPPHYELYEDITVLAFPISVDATINEEIHFLDYKLGFHELGGSAPDTRFLLDNAAQPQNTSEENDKSVYIVNKENVIDLSSFMDEKGILEWEAPDGEWNIMRIGYTCTKAHVSTSSEGWQGRVLDYLSKDAFDFYWHDVVEPILNASGEHVGTTLKFMETDSWECGGMNWTDNFADEFKNYRKYDLKNYLPVIAGHVVDNIDITHAFLADFRKTLADLVANNHYACFADYAHKNGMGIQPESAGPHAGPLDGIKNYGFSDIVMSEFWSPSPHRPTPQHRYFVKQASSAAHIYGKKIVGAESFTTIGPHWNDELWRDQKSAFDHEICSGLNRVYFHTFTCSPEEMGMPGQEYFAGTHVNPQVTWWDESGAFIDYLHRTQFIMQKGKFVADVLYYYGDHVPNVFSNKQTDPAGALPGFDYDVTDETILTRLKVKDGKIIVPGGIEYRVLVLPDHRVLSLDALKKVESILSQGAEVIGYKPERLISLVGDEKAQSEFQKLANRIWGEDTPDKGSKKYKKGTISWGISARDYLISKGISPDLEILNDNIEDFDYIHYTIGNLDVYFISNQTEDIQTIESVFRIEGRQPELWDALTGEIREATAFSQQNGRTTVPLTLEPYGAIIVLFNKEIDNTLQGKEKTNYPDFIPVQELEGNWNVYFAPEYGGPGMVNFPELIDWTTSKDEGIKFYSGAAIYYKDFHFTPQQDNSYFLQLEKVKDVGIAKVRMNGIDKGVVWTKPFRVDVTNELVEGKNSLEIEVINSWYNRVAGDEMNPKPDQITRTNVVLINDFRGNPRKEIPLEPSGLLGPVSVKKKEHH